MTVRLTCLGCLALLIPLLVPISRAAGGGQEEGEFRIMAGGREIGTEHYVLVSSGESTSSTSVVEFRNPSDSSKKVKLESKLEMDGKFKPRSYSLASDQGGKKGTIVGTFPANSAIFEYSKESARDKKGLLLGDSYTVLDTNIFHHFSFLAKLYRFEGKDKVQGFQVVIPQEADSGMLKISELGKETLTVQGKRVETRHLQVDSGSMIIHLWVDGNQLLQKITVPASGIEVIRIS